MDHDLSVYEEFEPHAELALRVLETSKDTCFHGHENGHAALMELIAMRPCIGQGRSLSWEQAADYIEKEHGVVLDIPKVKNLFYRRLDDKVALLSDANMRREVMSAAGTLNKAVDMQDIAFKMKKAFDNVYETFGKHVVNDDGEIVPIGCSISDLVKLSRENREATKDARDFLEDIVMAPRREKVPAVAFQSNTTIKLSDYFGDRRPPRVIDGEFTSKDTH